MTEVEKIRRDLTGGRPVSELKTPLAAVTAARTFHREMEARMTAAGLNPQPGDWAVSVGYVSPDLSVLGFTRLFTPGGESGLMEMLTGHIILGLVFGVMDKEAGRLVMGTRPFLSTKQNEGWLSELVHGVRLEVQEGQL